MIDYHDSQPTGLTSWAYVKNWIATWVVVQAAALEAWNHKLGAQANHAQVYEYSKYLLALKLLHIHNRSIQFGGLTILYATEMERNRMEQNWTELGVFSSSSCHPSFTFPVRRSNVRLWALKI